jgi:hypothetical protein
VNATEERRRLHRLEAKGREIIGLRLAITWHVTANQAALHSSRTQLDFHQDTPPNVLACDHD